jgi:hypothetical protein
MNKTILITAAIIALAIIPAALAIEVYTFDSFTVKAWEYRTVNNTQYRLIYWSYAYTWRGTEHSGVARQLFPVVTRTETYDLIQSRTYPLINAKIRAWIAKQTPNTDPLLTRRQLNNSTGTVEQAQT